jgi:molybdate transport system substrate-binding protein
MFCLRPLLQQARFRRALLRLLQLTTFLVPVSVYADDLRVAVASNFAPVLEQLAQDFETQSGHHLILIAGATGQHYAQIVNGAPFEVFLSADSERPAKLEADGVAVANSRFTYALGKLVLWSTESALVDAEGRILASGNFRHLAIANPALAPFGLAAQQVLEARKLWEQLQGRIVQGENITQTLQFVQTGNAELGFIAYSQWLQLDENQKGSVWQVPAEMHAPIVQQGVILRDSAAARAFVAFLQNEQSRSRILAQGYDLP